MLAPAVKLPGLVKKLRRVFGPLLPGTEHGGAFLVVVIALGKPLAGERGFQPTQFFLCGFPPLPHGGGINAGDDGDILRPLHPALDFQAGHAHLA